MGDNKEIEVLAVGCNYQNVDRPILKESVAGPDMKACELFYEFI